MLKKRTGDNNDYPVLNILTNKLKHKTDERLGGSQDRRSKTYKGDANQNILLEESYVDNATDNALEIYGMIKSPRNSTQVTKAGRGGNQLKIPGGSR